MIILAILTVSLVTVCVFLWKGKGWPFFADIDPFTGEPINPWRR